MLEPLTQYALRTLHASAYIRDRAPIHLRDNFNTPRDVPREHAYSMIVYDTKQFSGLKITPFGFGLVVVTSHF